VLEKRCLDCSSALKEMARSWLDSVCLSFSVIVCHEKIRREKCLLKRAKRDATAVTLLMAVGGSEAGTCARQVQRAHRRGSEHMRLLLYIFYK
jgi:hypothetical protein